VQRILYFLKRALLGIRGNLYVTLLSVVTITVSLLTLSTFLLLYLNLRASAAAWGGDVQVVAYLADGLPADEVNRLTESISRLAGVSAVKYVSREDAIERFRRDLGGQAGILDGLARNPLPACLEVQLRDGGSDPARVRAIAAEARAMRGVEDVQFGEEWIAQYSAALNLIRILGIVIGAFLLVGSALVVANTIRLAVYARREELEILSLVGASKPFVRIPFLIEGVLQGLLGAALAIAILYAGYRYVLPRVQGSLLLTAGNLDLAFLPGSAVLALLGVGAAVGLFGSALSVGRFGRT
jgi:cell division transport system permease protein